ncbi:hypothetical protein GGX14DRAFT_608507, partial [Mycena pura]
DPPAEAAPPKQQDRRARVEEVEDDEDAPGASRWYEDFPLPAGTPLQRPGELTDKQTTFDRIRTDQRERNLPPWHPFESKEDWELAQWLVRAGVSQSKIEEFLKLDKIKCGAQPSYSTSRQLFDKIDALPSGPNWSYEVLEIEGDVVDENGVRLKEEVELWKRDPVDCIKELMGNAAFRKVLRYAPIRVYCDEDAKKREYSEIWTANTWWELQEKLPEGATICPVILASDKTQLSTLSGDKQAWPVYLSIGNLPHDVRSKPSQRGTILLGYIPVSKLQCWSKANRSKAVHQLFHTCMKKLLAALKDAGTNGVEILCADEEFRLSFPILVAYLADYPEQCLVAGCMENRCPWCLVEPKKRGSPITSAPRDPATTLRLMKKNAQGIKVPEFEAQGLRPIEPFWADLPHSNIFKACTPDILHQLYKGVFKDHVVSWAITSLSESEKANEAEIDRRFQAMPQHPDLRHFKNGISLVSQWTGKEYKNMAKVFLGILNGATEPRVIEAVRGILDFICYARFEAHTDGSSDASLALLHAAWQRFHDNKDIFVDLDIRQDFNIPKIHSMQHYVEAIRALGCLSGYNTEISERLHIDCAKLGYRASNRRNYVAQMARWLTRRESIDRFDAYLRWAIPSYAVEQDRLEGDGINAEEDDKEDDDEDPSLLPDMPYTIARKAPFQNISVDILENEFGAKNFLYHLENFLRGESILPDNFANLLGPFPVYKRFKLAIKPVIQVGTRPIVDVIRATRGKAEVGLKKAVTARFDTVLARKAYPAGGIPKRLSLDGLFVGRIRAIFALPIQFGHYPTPLAYVEWYKPLTQLDKTLGMYKITPAMHLQNRRASIIPITLISRSCHLIPQFGPTAAPSMRSEDVLDVHKDFYLNCYLRLVDFVLLRR